jgi:hypothetical protein
MTQIFERFLGLALLLFPLNGAPSNPHYSQTYTILLRGVPSGIESVAEEWGKDGSLISSSESEIFITDGFETKRLAFVTRMALSKSNLVPISYSYRYTSGPSKDGYEVTVKDGQLKRTLIRAGHSSEITATLASDATILDFNVYHQYDYLLRKYDMKKGGRQSFHNFIPLIGGEIPLSISQLDDTNLQHVKGSLPVRNFKVEFAGIWSGTVSIDKGGRLVRLVVRDQDLEVVRKDLLPEPAPPEDTKQDADKEVPAKPVP